MVSWGIVTICTAAVSSYEGLIICRVFLGVAEAGFFVSGSVHISRAKADSSSQVSSAISASGMSSGDKGDAMKLTF